MKISSGEILAWTLVSLLTVGTAVAQSAIPRTPAGVDKWVTVTEEAAGTNANAQDEALKKALRKAVEENCGTFIRAQSKTRDYKAVYDKVMSSTAGYVVEHKIVSTKVTADTTIVTVTARVSTVKFEEDWSRIAHTIEQENNPRVIIGISEATRSTATGPAFLADENGTVQTKVEDFFLTKGIALVDRDTAAKVDKRDLLLASIKDAPQEIAAIGARFKAEVVVVGKAYAQQTKEVRLPDSDTTMYQYTAVLNVKVIQTDSARILVSKSFTPAKAITMLQQGAETQALAKLGEECAPKLLAAVLEAWRQRADVTRSVKVEISGMDYEGWAPFRDEVSKLRGIQAVRLREIVEGVAQIEIESEFTNENLADRLLEVKSLPVKIVEVSANRLKLVVKDRPASVAPAP